MSSSQRLRRVAPERKPGISKISRVEHAALDEFSDGFRQGTVVLVIYLIRSRARRIQTMELDL